MEQQRGRAVVIEDDPDLRYLMAKVLTDSAFEVTEAATGAAGLEAVERVQPDLITLDLNLPDTDGLVLCRGIRRVSDAYLLILSARADEIDKLIGLETGADDYMTKPFSTKELSARVGALLRRPRGYGPGGPTVPASGVSHGLLALDPERRTAELGGVELGLTKVEFDLLAVLMARSEKVVPREELLKSVWGVEWGDTHVVDVHVANLRRKITQVAHGDVVITTVRGIGFRLDQRS